MDTYQQADVKALVQDDSFRNWVLNPTPEQDVLWEKYLLKNPQQASAIAQAREIVCALGVQNRSISETEIQLQVKQAMAFIKKESETEVAVEEIIEEEYQPWYLRRWVGFAASFIALIGLGVVVYRFANPVILEEEITTVAVADGFTEKTNPSKHPVSMVLPDGSRVILKANSYIRYASSFTGVNRNVFLTGEAFFSVVKNPSRPFLVYTNGLVTKVLGTSFTVSAYESNEHITVAVKTGKVSVFASKDTLTEKNIAQPGLSGIILTPNQKIVFSRNEVKLQKSLVDIPIVTIPEKELARLVFEDAPASKVFNALEKAYSIDIVYDEELMAHCALTASLGKEPLLEQLTVLCKAIEAHYEVIDGQIIVRSKGCH